MNYYEHHIGDYDQATAHLTACEDGIYSRMIRLCMASEKPLPADVPWIVRRVRANTKDERKAVETILGEFFELQADGYHQHRCDSEIARFREKEPDREAKKENERERQRRSRDRRKQLFDTLRQHGYIPEYDAKMRELNRALSRIESQATSQIVTGSVTRDATATHSPLPTPHTPNPIPKTKASASDDSSPPTAERALFDAGGQAPTPAGAVCRAMREKAGFTGCNPGDPRLLALLEQGATEDEFVGIATEAVGGAKGWAWVLTVLQARRKDAQALRLAPPVDGGPGEWHETRGGVEAKAKAMGMPKWDECSSWATYKSAVIAAAGKRLEAA